MKESFPSIGQVLPPEVKSLAMTVSETTSGAFLFPEESALVARAVPQRRLEFSLGRFCARQALAELGFPWAPILAGPQRQPLWPSGIVGSLTHCSGYVAAAVAEASNVIALGIDAEPQIGLPPETFGLILSESERTHLGRLPANEIAWERLIASAKESVFKAWYPLTGRWLDFLDAEVTVDPGSGTFAAHLRVASPRLKGRDLSCWHGRYLMQQGLILTAVALKTGLDAVPNQS
ncbi:MAG TPA: 4'-phosphopantetheinyl transferase superfamily protein [Verrucomicrobiota bacterium]|nr:4'-phosphopantetheinyl transferase [Verrucomicrobiales bacterium]HRI15382.1 4'-phosphopantetheinyl transferase superfamily protein [Verrucomicrobiota bacterium]